MPTIPFRHGLLGLLASAAALAAAPAGAVGVPGQGTWATTLQARDLDGNGETDAFYDRGLDITWLRSAYHGAATWDQAVRWAAGLQLGGTGGWRLPALRDTGAPGCEAYSVLGGTDCGYNVLTRDGGVVYSELAHLWYVTLGNWSRFEPGTGQPAPPGAGLSNTGPFAGLQPQEYWTGTAYADPRHTAAWSFDMAQGGQYHSGRGVPLQMIAVHDGDLLPAVPAPPSALMLAAGLAAMAGWMRRRPPG